MPANFLILMADQLTAGALERLRRCGADAEYRFARAAGSHVRLFLLQQPAVRPLAVLISGRAIALPNRRL